MVLTSCSRSDTEQFWGSSASLPMLPKTYHTVALSKEHHYIRVPRSELYTADAQLSFHYL